MCSWSCEARRPDVAVSVFQYRETTRDFQNYGRCHEGSQTCTNKRKVHHPTVDNCDGMIETHHINSLQVLSTVAHSYVCVLCFITRRFLKVKNWLQSVMAGATLLDQSHRRCRGVNQRRTVDKTREVGVLIIKRPPIEIYKSSVSINDENKTPRQDSCQV